LTLSKKWEYKRLDSSDFLLGSEFKEEMNRLGSSGWELVLEHKDRFYFRRLCEAAQKYKKVWFSDITEQRKFRLKNQSTYQMTWLDKDKIWNIELFHEIKQG